MLPLLDKPPQEQDWDIAIWGTPDVYGNTAQSFLAYYFLREAEFRWIKYDPVYEEMFKDMARTAHSEPQEGKIRQMEQYVYDRGYKVFVYSPLTLYAKHGHHMEHCWEGIKTAILKEKLSCVRGYIPCIKSEPGKNQNR